MARINEVRRSPKLSCCNHAAVRWFLRHRKVDPDDLEAVPRVRGNEDGQTGYYEGKVPEYLKACGGGAAMIEKVADLERQALARMSAPHLFAYPGAP